MLVCSKIYKTSLITIYEVIENQKNNFSIEISQAFVFLPLYSHLPLKRAIIILEHPSPIFDLDPDYLLWIKSIILELYWVIRSFRKTLYYFSISTHLVEGHRINLLWRLLSYLLKGKWYSEFPKKKRCLLLWKVDVGIGCRTINIISFALFLDFVCSLFCLIECLSWWCYYAYYLTSLLCIIVDYMFVNERLNF